MFTRDRDLDANAKALVNQIQTQLAPAISLTDKIIALMKQTRHATKVFNASVFCTAKAGAVTVKLVVAAMTDLVVGTTLAIDAVPQKFKTITTTAVYLVAGVETTKAPTAALVFTAAHTVNNAQVAGTFWGAILVQVDGAGAVTTKVVSADQAYVRRELAVAALPKADALKVALGYIVIQSKVNIKWTANTDDMTNASGVTTAEFISAVERAVLTGPITPVAASEVQGVLSAVKANVQAELNENIVVLATTDGTGALTNGRLHLTYRAARAFRNE